MDEFKIEQEDLYHVYCKDYEPAAPMGSEAQREMLWGSSHAVTHVPVARMSQQT